jgi:hypothetical protein
MDIANLLVEKLTIPSTEGEEGAATNISLWTYFMIAWPFFVAAGLGTAFLYVA